VKDPQVALINKPQGIFNCTIYIVTCHDLHCFACGHVDIRNRHDKALNPEFRSSTTSVAPLASSKLSSSCSRTTLTIILITSTSSSITSLQKRYLLLAATTWAVTMSMKLEWYLILKLSVAGPTPGHCFCTRCVGRC
jgi:hypothetical protein